MSIFIISFIVGCLIGGIWYETRKVEIQAENIVNAFFPSKERHEKEGNCVCKKCGKKFIASSLHASWDIVMTVDGDCYWYSCSHCSHSWTEPIKTIVSKTD